VVAFIVSCVVMVLMVIPIIAVGKRRPRGTPFTWAEAMLGSIWITGLAYLAYGVVPHLFLTWADANLGWSKDKLLYGPGEILKPRAKGGPFIPMTLHWEIIRDSVVMGIYSVVLPATFRLWKWWQIRGEVVAAEVEVSSFGRPLAKKG
jgi:hypothetical protein